MSRTTGRTVIGSIALAGILATAPTAAYAGPSAEPLGDFHEVGHSVNAQHMGTSTRSEVVELHGNRAEVRIALAPGQHFDGTWRLYGTGDDFFYNAMQSGVVTGTGDAGDPEVMTLGVGNANSTENHAYAVAGVSSGSVIHPAVTAQQSERLGCTAVSVSGDAEHPKLIDYVATAVGDTVVSWGHRVVTGAGTPSNPNVLNVCGSDRDGAVDTFQAFFGPSDGTVPASIAEVGYAYSAASPDQIRHGIGSEVKPSVTCPPDYPVISHEDADELYWGGSVAMMWGPHVSGDQTAASPGSANFGVTWINPITSPYWVAAATATCSRP